VFSYTNIANDIPIAPFNPVKAIIKAYFSVIPYPIFFNHPIKHDIEINLAKIQTMYTNTAIQISSPKIISVKLSTFTPILTPAIKNILVYATKTM
jgi:hypothetical protein